MKHPRYGAVALVIVIRIITVWLLNTAVQPAIAISANSIKSQATTTTATSTGVLQTTTGTPMPTLSVPQAIPTCVPTVTANTAGPTALPTSGTAVPTAAQPATPTCIPGTMSQATVSSVAVSTAVSSGGATPPATAPSTAAPTAASSSNQPGKVNMDAILPPDPARDLLFNNCTSCHSWVCAVIGQRTTDDWDRLKLAMRQRVSGMTDADFETLFNYLKSNFNDQKPVPDLPPEIAAMGCVTPG